MASLLAVCFGEGAALGAPGILSNSGHQNLNDFDEWALCDLVANRFPDVDHPWLRFDAAALTARCAGDPLTLLWEAADEPSSIDNGRFPIGAFVSTQRASRTLGIDIADVHLHSGASVPLDVFFSALATRCTPIERAELDNRTIRLPSGEILDLYVLLTATRWAFRFLRAVRDGTDTANHGLLEERGFHLAVVDLVSAGRYWEVVASVCRAAELEDDEAMFVSRIARHFEDSSLCDFPDLLRRVSTSPAYHFSNWERFVLGTVRAVVLLGMETSSRPGEGLSRFVDRFQSMGLTRDAGLGEFKTRAISWTLAQTAASPDVVGAEFRKTIVARGRDEFRAKVVDALWDHTCGFRSFTQEHGRAMALTVPIGFHRRPASGRGDDWTDGEQLADALLGVRVLRRLLSEDDGALAETISSVDVAGDEYGSASWPYALAAGLLDRHGVALRYSIHAGESFMTPLNGVRRVGELLLADRVPERIGHALALCERTADLVCRGPLPPLRYGDAICDALWIMASGYGDVDEAARHVYDLVKPLAGRRAIMVDTWLEAYMALWSIDELERLGIIELLADGDWHPAAAETLSGIARAGSDVARAVVALVNGEGALAAGCDVKALVPAALGDAVRAHSEQQAVEARCAVQEAMKRQPRPIVIESCPTSNIRLAGLGSADDHPLWQWQRDGLEIAIGSDDPIIFGATIVDEFAQLISSAETREAVARLAQTSIDQCGSGRRRSVDFDEVLDKLSPLVSRQRRHNRPMDVHRRGEPHLA